MRQKKGCAVKKVLTSRARSGIIHFAFWRRSSVGQSIRFIPGVSPVRIQSPLPPGRQWRPGALWPVGQVVKTPPFHGGNMGSNPVRVTNFISCGGLAQQVRAPASHAGGHWFESSSLHQKNTVEFSFRGAFLYCIFIHQFCANTYKFHTYTSMPGHMPGHLNYNWHSSILGRGNVK